MLAPGFVLLKAEWIFSVHSSVNSGKREAASRVQERNMGEGVRGGFHNRGAEILRGPKEPVEPRPGFLRKWLCVSIWWEPKKCVLIEIHQN